METERKTKTVKAWAVVTCTNELNSNVYSYHGHQAYEIFPTRKDAKHWIGDNKAPIAWGNFKITPVTITYTPPLKAPKS